MKVCAGRESLVPVILNLDTQWNLLVNMSHAETKSRTPLIGDWVGRRVDLGRFSEEKFFLMPGFEHRIGQPVA